jgi:hypothetical protein
VLKPFSFDRFSQGLRDPQEAPVMAHCAACGGEIYPHEDVYVINGDILHNMWECLVQYVDPSVMTVEDALGVEE